ncbi:MAG: glycosyltransferase family 2 protein [Phycisphaerae bacterium]|nr:glycosyltransferase family 2 protein [Phycisphaerae bacterium]
MNRGGQTEDATRDGGIDLSVVICTYNRAESLNRALASIHAARIPEGCSWEVLVIDNRSTDHTPRVAGAWSDRLPLRYLYESEPGLSAARNRALVETRGRLLAFTDDDVEVDGAWLAALLAARRCWPTASYLAGQILPAYDYPRPSWLTEQCERMLAGVVVRFSLPRKSGPLTPGEPRPMGANLAFDARRLRDVGGFRTDLGRNGTSLIGGEEVAVLAELERQGSHGVYVPEAIVNHYTPADRLRRAFLVRYFTAVGRAAVRLGEIAPVGRLGPPRWMVRKLVSTGLAYVPSCVAGRPENWIERMRSFGFYLGATWELLRHDPRARIEPPAAA